MLHDWKTFGEEISTLLKTSGDTGDSGDKSEKRSKANSLLVSTLCADVSPGQNKWRHDVAASGDKKVIKNHDFNHAVSTVSTVSTVSSVSTNFAGGAKSCAGVPAKAQDAVGESRLAHSFSGNLPDGLPAEWVSGYAAFCVMPPLDDWPADRWPQAIRDGHAFLSLWGLDAVRLGWSAADLFGASPIAPWRRVGMLGLIPLLNGDEVVSLDIDTATIRAASGAMLCYRRHIVRGGRACLWEIGGAA